MLILLLIIMPHVASDTSKSPHCHSISVLWFPRGTQICIFIFCFHISTAQLLCLEFSITCGTQHSRNGAFSPSISRCNHKLHANKHGTLTQCKGNCPKKCNVLMENSCTVKYTVSECILKISSGFFLFVL